MELNDRVKKYRKLLGYTQLDMSKKIGCNIATYCRYERGEIDIPSRSLLKIADIFHISLDTLAGREVNSPVCNNISEEIEYSKKWLIEKKKSKVGLNLELAAEHGILSYAQDINAYIDCTTMSARYEFISHLSNSIKLVHLNEIFHISKHSYYQYLKEGRNRKRLDKKIVENIEALSNKPIEEIADELGLSSNKVMRIIDKFELKQEKEKYEFGKGQWILDSKQFKNMEVFIIVDPSSGYVLGIGTTPSEAYVEALDTATGLIELDEEPGYRSGKSDFFYYLISEYLDGERPTRYLVARYMFFFNNIRVDEDGGIKVEKLLNHSR